MSSVALSGLVLGPWGVLVSFRSGDGEDGVGLQ